MSYDSEILGEAALEAYWKGEEITGSTAVDASPNGEDATIFTTAPVPTLGIGGPIETDTLSLGVQGRFAEHPTTPGSALDLVNDFTIEFWFKTDDLVQDYG